MLIVNKSSGKILCANGESRMNSEFEQMLCLRVIHDLISRCNQFLSFDQMYGWIGLEQAAIAIFAAWLGWMPIIVEVKYFLLVSATYPKT